MAIPVSAFLKIAGAAALTGIGAHLQQKHNATTQKRVKKGCTPCAAAAAAQRANAAVKSGRF